MLESQLALGSLALSAVSLLSACSDAPADIGEKLTQQTQLSQPAKTGVSAFVGSWDGYVEAHQFEDGSDRIRLTIDEQGDGTMRFGNRELFASAKDPKAPYPPQNETGWFDGLSIWSGFNYAAQQMRINDTRIRMSIAESDVFAGYCSLQTPIDDRGQSDNPEFKAIDCVPPMTYADRATDGSQCEVREESVDGGTGTITQYSCQQYYMCSERAAPRPVCSCEATQCSVRPSSSTSFDGALDAGQQMLSGTMVITSVAYSTSTRINVRLLRQ